MRTELDVDQIFHTNFDACNQVEETMYHYNFVGVCKEGRPVKVDRLAKFDSEKIAKIVTLEEWKKVVIWNQGTPFFARIFFIRLKFLPNLVGKFFY